MKKKQILFATGTAGQTALLTPADRGVLAVASELSKHHTESRMKKYNGRDLYWAYFSRKNLTDPQLNAFGSLCQRISPAVEYYGFRNDYFVLYTSTAYRFYGAELVEALKKLNSQVAGLPATVSDDQYRATDGRTISVRLANVALTLSYTIPFDEAAWQLRHQTDAEVQTVDAAAKLKQAEADQSAATAKQAEQKAGLMKTLRVALVAAMGAASLVVLAKIFKK